MAPDGMGPADFPFAVEDIGHIRVTEPAVPSTQML